MFRQGYSLRSFQDVNMFPYRDDNVPRLQKSLHFSTTVATPLEKQYSDFVKSVDFNFRFNINTIDFNSRLNEHISKLLRDSNEDVTKAITRDYQVNKRQYAFYILDCTQQPLKDLCSRRDMRQIKEKMNAEYGDQIYLGIIEHDEYRSNEVHVMEEIERLLNDQFAVVNGGDKDTHNEDMTKMFKKNLMGFVKYLKNDLGSKMERL